MSLKSYDMNILDLPGELHMLICCAVATDSEDQMRSSLIDLLHFKLSCTAFHEASNSPAVWRSYTESKWAISGSSWSWRRHDPENCWARYVRTKLALDCPFPWQFLNVTERNDRNGAVVAMSPRMRQGIIGFGDNVLISGGHTHSQAGFDRKDDLWMYDMNNSDAVASPFALVECAQSLPRMSRHSLVCVDGVVYSLFGILQDKRKINTVYKYETLTDSKGSWSEVHIEGPGPEPRNDSVVAIWRESVIVAFGGSLEGFVFPSDVWLLDVRAPTLCWQRATIDTTHGGEPNTRISCCGAIVGDYFYIFGGGLWDQEKESYTARFYDMWRLDLVNWRWDKIVPVGDIPFEMSIFCNVSTIGDFLLIDGGRDYISQNEAGYIFDTVRWEWRKASYVSSSISPFEIDIKVPISNSACCARAGTKLIYTGILPPFELDLSHLNFLYEQQADMIASE